MDLSSRLRAIVKGGPPKPLRELTYEPDIGGYEAVMDLSRVGAVLGGRPVETSFGQCLVIDRRYEADRFHGAIRIGECEVEDSASLAILDPSLAAWGRTPGSAVQYRGQTPDAQLRTSAIPYGGQTPDAQLRTRRTIFIDLETTGLSGGAGTVAFLVGCGYFDLGAFQVRQFLLTSFAAERALLAAVADFFDGADLIVTYNGKTFDVPVMETRWLFHRLRMPLDAVPHFDVLHPARRLWKMRGGAGDVEGCRLTTLERALFKVTRVGDVPGLEIPGRFFRFLRSGDPRPLEPVLEHNRLDLVSLAAVMARAVRLVEDGADGCPDEPQALAVGRIYERAGLFDRAEACYRRASTSDSVEVRGESLYRLGLRCRRDRRFIEAAGHWRELVALTEHRSVRRHATAAALRQFAVEALAIHHEHRERDLAMARELALFALQEGEKEGGDHRRADGYRHRLARLERKLEKLAEKENAQLFSS